MKPKRAGRKGVIDTKTLFLGKVAELGCIKDAARAADISRNNHYDWMKSDPKYPARYKEALERATDAAEDEMRRRAVIGVYEPNIFQGRFVYPQIEVEIEPAVLDRKGRVIQPARTEWRDKPNSKPLGVYRKSDSLLMFWLRAWKPERYRKAIELSGPEGGPIEIVERLNAGRERARRLALEDREKAAEKAKDDAGRG